MLLWAMAFATLGVGFLLPRASTVANLGGRRVLLLWAAAVATNLGRRCCKQQAMLLPEADGVAASCGRRGCMRTVVLSVVVGHAGRRRGLRNSETEMLRGSLDVLRSSLLCCQPEAEVTRRRRSQDGGGPTAPTYCPSQAGSCRCGGLFALDVARVKAKRSWDFLCVREGTHVDTC